MEWQKYLSSKYCEYIAYIYILTYMDFSFYSRHIGLATKTDQMNFGVDPKLHICIEHLALEWKYCIIVQFEINIDWLGWELSLFISALKFRGIYFHGWHCHQKNTS